MAEIGGLSMGAAAASAAPDASEPGFVRWFRGAVQPTTWLAIASLTILWFGIAYQMNQVRKDAYRREVQAAEALAEALSRQIDDAIQSAEAILLSLQHAYERAVALAGEPTASTLVEQLASRQQTPVVVTYDSAPAPANAPPTVELLPESTSPQDGSRIAFRLEISRRVPAGDALRSLRISTFAALPTLSGPQAASVGLEDGFLGIVMPDGTSRTVNHTATSVTADASPPQITPAEMASARDGPITRWVTDDTLERTRWLLTLRAIGDPGLAVFLEVPERAALGGVSKAELNYLFAGYVISALIFLVIALGILRELKLREFSQGLESSNMKLDLALENIPQGLAMLDQSERVIVSNRRYAELYDILPALIRPGMTLAEVIQLRITHGLIDDAGAEGFRLDASRPSRVQQLNDGRTMLVSKRAMPSGGWVVTHEDITHHQQIEAKILHLAHHDPLTDLANRTSLLQRIDEALARLDRHGQAFAVLMLDLDHFKAINDTLGHAAGDALLRSVATRLKSCIHGNDCVARLGGDEFAIVQTASRNQRQAAVALAARLRDAVRTPFDLNGQQISLGTSIGIAVAPDDGTDADQLMRNADLALYRSKSEGRNDFRFYDPEMDADARARHSLELALRNSIMCDDFVLEYQPILTINSEICGAEALIRWHRPGGGVVSPAEFIGIAEETGLIVPLGQWILGQACADAAQWPAGIKVAVNLSPAQFSGDIVAVVTAALATTGLDPRRLELEITESILFHANDRSLGALHQLKALGVSVVLDDFGTGYSSLNYLMQFPFDKVKIDRSFISDIATRPDCAAVVCAITGLARSLRMLTTAEGVETVEQFRLLQAAGCSQVQGYLFGCPGPVSGLDFTSLGAGARMAG
jgi:diguanylate cyclase (GGDEF)-like protein